VITTETIAKCGPSIALKSINIINPSENIESLASNSGGLKTLHYLSLSESVLGNYITSELYVREYGRFAITLDRNIRESEIFWERMISEDNISIVN